MIMTNDEIRHYKSTGKIKIEEMKDDIAQIIVRVKDNVDFDEISIVVPKDRIIYEDEEKKKYRRIFETAIFKNNEFVELKHGYDEF
jgi:hypothetical protein